MFSTRGFAKTDYSDTLLEDESKRDLHDARIARQARDRAERRGIADVPVRQAEVDRVEHVEDVPAQRGRQFLAKAEVPLQGQIEVLEPRTAEPVAELIAEHAGGHRREGCQVEPLVDRLRSVRVAIHVDRK